MPACAAAHVICASATCSGLVERQLRGALDALVEHREAVVDAPDGEQGAAQHAGRDHLAVPVAHLGEELVRRLAVRNRLGGAATPQAQHGEQVAHHAFGPTVAALAGLDVHPLGHGLGFGVAALVVADEGEQPGRPAEPARVADLGERLRPTR